MPRGSKGPRRRSSPKKSGRSKSIQRKKNIAAGAQYGAPNSKPTPAPEGKAPAGNLGKQLKAKLKGLFPPVQLTEGAQMFGKVFRTADDDKNK